METLATVERINERWGKENKLSPEEVAKTHQDKVQILCFTCEQYDWRKPKEIINNPDRCSVCAGKTIIVGYNDALTHNPFLKEIWGEQNTTEPTDYSKNSGKKVWIKCKKCHQETLRQISNTIINPDGCSVCAGKLVIAGVNDLQSQNPTLAEEWSAQNTLKADEVIAGGRGTFWWTCRKCNGDWEAMMGWRLQGTGCPHCSGLAVTEGVNDLATTLPELLETWDYEKNTIKPTELSRSSQKKVWWKCEAGHSWETSPAYRHKNSKIHNCNTCSRQQKRSKLEIELYEFCKTLDSQCTPSVKDLISNAEIDIYFPKQKIAIEFNGDYWHSDKVMEDKYGINAYSYHKERHMKAKELGITLIYVWESDWLHRREKVEKNIKSLINSGTLNESLFFKFTNSNNKKTMIKTHVKQDRPLYKIKCDEKREFIKTQAKKPEITIESTASIIDVAPSSLKRWLKEEYITWLNKKNSKLSEEQVKLLKNYAQTISKSEAARKFNCSRILIERYCEDYQISWNFKAVN